MILPSTRAVAWHEASHAAALALAGMTPIWVRVDRPSESLLGSVRVDWEKHDPVPTNLRVVLIAALQGPISDGELVDDWPIDPSAWSDGSRRDAEQAAFLADALKLDEVDWRFIVYKAQALGRERQFRQLVVEIANALEHHELLLLPELEALTARVRNQGEHGNG